MSQEQNLSVHTPKYYTSMEKLSKRYQQTQRSCAFEAKTPEEFTLWRERTRKTLRELTGIEKLSAAPPLPQLLETEELPEEPYRRHRYLIQTEEDIWMPFYLLEPKIGAAKKPVMICPHGHGSGGKLATGGRFDVPEVAAVSAEQHYEYGVEYAKRGFLTFCPDARGFGERRESCKQGDAPDQYMGSCCRELNNMAIPLGLTVTGMWAFDLMCLLDYIETRPDCDCTRIGAAGLSGGGQQTLWLAALDDRIGAAVVSGYFYGYHDALLLLNGNCSCNYVPHLWETVDMGDIGAMIAPRPLLVETGDHDPLNGHTGVDNVKTQLEITRRAYRLMGKEENCAHSIGQGVHRFYGGESYDFICKALDGITE